ncbi:MAG: hypothetical protein CL569_04235 [Alphaproteobacteria bacterium]|nr:hypothetical protein [Alphaproteobacteria bacterium]|tara:strand:- start:205 stop:594 length:390 start_codon:yes stop_codon:yes gene_type:complete
MTQADNIDFRAGQNIAMKVPAHELDETVRFYRDVVGLEQLQSTESSIAFHFGRIRLWIDRCPQLSRAEVWLQMVVESPGPAEDYLKSHDVVRCDDIGPLPDGFDGYWIMNPAGSVHLVTGPKDAEPMTA